MDAIIRATVVYGFLMLMFRVAGKRTLAQITPFDLVLVLIIGEATQQGLLGADVSLTNAMLVITTLIGLDICFGILQRRFPRVDRVVEGVPVLLVEDGEPVRTHVEGAGIRPMDILAQARELHGLERMDQIRYAVLERSGAISIIPKECPKE